MQTLQGDYAEELADMQSELEQLAAFLCREQELAKQQVAGIDSRLSQVKEQLSQLRAADSQAALHTDAAQDSADDSPEELPLKWR
jgi:ABC-type Fe3+-hydroxamate transport system substrate-binding protein